MHAASVVLMTPALDRVTEVFDLAGILDLRTAQDDLGARVAPPSRS